MQTTMKLRKTEVNTKRPTKKLRKTEVSEKFDEEKQDSASRSGCKPRTTEVKQASETEVSSWTR